MVEDARPDVAAAALAALGATLDRRLVPEIRDVPWPAELMGSDLALERGRTLLRLGDWSEAPALIRGLRDERLYTRALCSEALTEATRETFSYDPRAEERERERAVQRWEKWWMDRVNDGLLNGN